MTTSPKTEPAPVETARGRPAIVVVDDEPAVLAALSRDQVALLVADQRMPGMTARGIVVDRYDGTLDVESEPGRTAFRVWLPLG